MTHPPYLIGLIGEGVTPSLTPAMHMAEAAAHDLRHVYRLLDLPTMGMTADDLPAILDWAERFGFTGVNVTHPCKQTVIALLDEVEPTAAAIGAVNTVVFTPEGRVGHNTDTTGFERAVRSEMPDVAREHVVQLGAGGAGSAVADALLRLGAQRLTIIDVDPARAGALAADLASRHGRHVDAAAPADAEALLASADGIVNCTPIGMAAHPGSPIDVTLLREHMWVADIVYFPLETALLRAARAVGCRTLDGGHMAVGQAVGAFELFTGVSPDASRMDAHFRTLVSTPNDR